MTTENVTGWKTVQLHEVCRPKQWQTIKKSEMTEAGFPVYGANGTIGRYHSFNHAKPTILIGCRGSCGAINVCEPNSWVTGNAMALEDLDTSRVDFDFMVYALKADGLREAITGTSQPQITQTSLKRVQLLLPPLEEQRRIAGVLHAAEALRAKRRQALAKLDSLTQAVFVDRFDAAVSGDSEWPVECLADVVAEGTTVTYGIVQAGEEFPDGVPYIRTGDIVDGQIRIDGLRRTDPAIAEKFPRSCVRAGEIVMSIRATVGTTAIVPAALDGSNLTQGTARISPGECVDGTYLLEYLRSDVSQRWIQRQVKGATFREITLGRLREMPVLIPPLRLQREFAETCQQAGQLRSTLEESLDQLDTLFASLQQRAFRGEL